METVREILAAHGSGISRPGLLAWARLRIDAAMTEAQLDEELARLGDEVVDDAGFLYLRQNIDAGHRLARTDVPPIPGRPAPEPRGSGARSAPSGVQAPSESSSTPPEWTPGPAGWNPPAAARRSFGSIAKAIGTVFFALWVAGFVGGFFEAFTDGTTAAPTAAATPTGGSVVNWDEIAVGDCLVLPTEDEFSEIRRVPCESPHGGEVFLVVDHPDNAYPADDAMASFADAACRPAFATWTGSAFDDQALLDINSFSPTRDSWEAGNRTVQCYLALSDGSQAARSYRGANP
ncbi:MAG: septum formation family protein, partial [Chloroflexota bacterium]